MSRKIISIKRFNQKTGEVTLEICQNQMEKFLVAQKSVDDPSPTKKLKVESPVEEQPKSNGLFSGNPSSSLFGNQVPSTANFGSKPIAEAAPLEQAAFKAPNQSVFGQNKPVTGLFGNAGAAAAPSGGLFGNAAAAPSGGLFGNAAKPTGALFGTSNAPAQAGGQPDTPAPPKATGLFVPPAQVGGNSLFAGTAKPSGSFFGQTAPSAGTNLLFGGAPPASGGLFGGSTPTPGGLFGGTAPAAGGLFGGSTPASSGPFGQPAAQGSLFGNSTSIFGNPQANIFKKDDATAEDSEADYQPDADEPPTVTLGSDIVLQKSPFRKIFELTVEKFKVATPVTQKKNLQNGRVSIHRGDFDGTIMCKIIFQNNIGKNLYEANISAICKYRRVTEKTQKNQLKIAAIKTNPENKKLEMQYCLINFSREDDIKQFEKHFQEMVEELKKIGEQKKQK